MELALSVVGFPGGYPLIDLTWGPSLSSMICIRVIWDEFEDCGHVSGMCDETRQTLSVRGGYVLLNLCQPDRARKAFYAQEG